MRTLLALGSLSRVKAEAKPGLRQGQRWWSGETTRLILRPSRLSWIERRFSSGIRLHSATRQDGPLCGRRVSLARFRRVLRTYVSALEYPKREFHPGEVPRQMRTTAAEELRSFRTSSLGPAQVTGRSNVAAVARHASNSHYGAA